MYDNRENMLLTTGDYIIDGNGWIDYKPFEKKNNLDCMKKTDNNKILLKSPCFNELGNLFIF